jgi:periplasmic protein TonB
MPLRAMLGSGVVLGLLATVLSAPAAGGPRADCSIPPSSASTRPHCDATPASATRATKARPGSPGALRLAALDDRETDVMPPMTDDEARRALERELSLKVGKQMREADYPDEAQRWRWSGTAMVEVRVTGEGLVQDVQLAQTSGFRMLDRQALEVVRRVSKVYVPVQLRGRPQRAVVPVGFHFKPL